MESHLDRDFDWGLLKERAKDAVGKGASTITGGAPGEKPIRKWDYGDMRVTKLSADEQGILRISIGGGIPKLGIDYCVYRGSRETCLALLEEAVEALKQGGGE